MKITTEEKAALKALCDALNGIEKVGRINEQCFAVYFEEKDKDGKVKSTEKFVIKLRNKTNDDGIDTQEYRAKEQR